MVQVNSGSSGTAAIDKDYPAVEGLIIGTTKIEGKDSKLQPEIDLCGSKHWGSI